MSLMREVYDLSGPTYHAINTITVIPQYLQYSAAFSLLIIALGIILIVGVKKH